MKIIVVVSGGVVQEVASTDGIVGVRLINLDELEQAGKPIRDFESLGIGSVEHFTQTVLGPDFEPEDENKTEPLTLGGDNGESWYAYKNEQEEEHG